MDLRKGSWENYIEITISFLKSSVKAHEYLIDWYMISPLPLEIRKKSRDVPPIVGDISFYKGQLFIRNNIIVDIYAEGNMRYRVEDIAREIDGLLLDQEIFQTYEMLKPRIFKDSTNVQNILEP